MSLGLNLMKDHITLQVYAVKDVSAAVARGGVSGHYSFHGGPGTRLAGQVSDWDRHIELFTRQISAANCKSACVNCILLVMSGVMCEPFYIFEHV